MPLPNPIDQETIDAYVSGRLAGRDKIDFEDKMAKDAKLRSEIELMKRIQEGIRKTVLSEKLKDVKNWEQEDLRSGTIHQGTRGDEAKEVPLLVYLRKYRWQLGIAASFLLITGLFWINSGPSEQERELQAYLDENFEHVPSGVSVMRSESPSSNLSATKLQAYGLYEIGEYNIAAPMLEEVWQTEMDTIALFFAGVAWLGAGDIEKAKEIIFQEQMQFTHYELEKVQNLITNLENIQ